MAGSIVDRDLRHLALAAPFIIAGGIVVLGTRRWLDALSLGEDTALTLGADTASLGFRLTLGVGLMVGAATSIAGVIGFVGLVAPHLVRARVGYRPGATMVPSMLLGASMVLGADIIVRLLPTAYTISSGRSEPRNSATTFRDGASGSDFASILSVRTTFSPRDCMRCSNSASSTLSAAAGMRRVVES